DSSILLIFICSFFLQSSVYLHYLHSFPTRRSSDLVNAVHTLLGHLGASMEDTLAFGDAENDMQMVEKCGIGVAMGNAENDLKEVADYVTTDVNQDGMLKAFEHFGLI